MAKNKHTPFLDVPIKWSQKREKQLTPKQAAKEKSVWNIFGK